MIVLMLERIPRGMRGELSRWMIEPRANVFIGNASAMVRDRLWEMACAESNGGSAFMVYSTNNEQGFVWRVWGTPTYVPEDFEGLLLVRRGS
jgi:CRISPR-associated protein Cas2